MTELVFVSAPGCSVFMVELLEVVADAVRSQGGRARAVTGWLGSVDADPDSVFVVVPHEYLAMDPDPGISALARTIAFGVEHPGTSTFEASVTSAAYFAALFEINPASVAESRRRGLLPHLFSLGYSPLWDYARSAGVPAVPSERRDVDVLHMGTLDRRRSGLLASYAEDLVGVRTRLLLPPHEPMVGPRPDFLIGASKHEALSNSKVLINIHREGSAALEWVRVLEALINGCAVVSELSVGYEPLVPGVHCYFGRPPALGAMAAQLAADPERLDRTRSDVAEVLATELSMAPFAAELLEVADSVAAAASTRGRPRARPPVRPTADHDGPLAEWVPVLSDAEERPTSGPTVAVPVLPRRGPVAGDEITTQSWAAPARLTSTSGAPDVQVVVGRLPGDGPVGATVVSMDRYDRPWTLRLAAAAHPSGDRPARSEPAGLSRGALRNAALSDVGAQWIAVLDPGDEFLPDGLAALVEAGSAARADIVVGMAAHAGGLLNALPPELRRLRVAAYLSRGYLIRPALLEALGGWSDDPLLDGMVDHDLWQRALAADATWAFRPSIVARFWRQAPATRTVDVDPPTVWRELRRRSGEASTHGAIRQPMR